MANVREQVRVKIKEYRLRAGLTQEGLALSANMHTSFISEIERGLKTPSIESLEKLLSALNVSFKEFFDFDVNVKTLKNCTALEKLTNELNTRSAREAELIYIMAKQVFAYMDGK